MRGNSGRRAGLDTASILSYILANNSSNAGFFPPESQAADARVCAWYITDQMTRFVAARHVHRSAASCWRRRFSSHRSAQDKDSQPIQLNHQPNLGKHRWPPSLIRSLDLSKPSPIAQEIRRRLKSNKEHPAAILRSLATREDVTPDALVLLLAELQTRLKKLSRRDRLKAILDQPIAKHALAIIWKADDLWRIIARDAHDAVFTLCCYAIAEDAEEYIIEWLQTEVPQSTDNTRESGKWRGVLYRGLIEGHLVMQTDFSADRAIQTFFTINEATQKAKRDWTRRVSKGENVPAPPTVTMSTQPAAFALIKGLTLGTLHNTNSEAYDKFVAFRSRALVQEPYSRNLELAALSLAHPTRPKSDQAVALIDEYYNSARGPVKPEYVPSSPRARKSTSMFFARAVKLLRSDGRPAEADRITAVYAEFMGEPLDLECKV